MPVAAIRDIDVYYEFRGSGPQLLFIGGTGGDLRNKPNIFDSPLTEHFEVLAYDQRGLGRTSIPDGPYTMGDYGEDAAALLAVVGWDRCKVVGASFGGMVAQELACRHSERVERLVLACTSSGGAGGASYPLHELQDLGAQERAEIGVELSDTRRTAAWRAENPKQWEAMVAMARERAAVGDAEPRRELGARLQLEARAKHDAYARLGDLGMPVYVCAGRYDGGYRPKIRARSPRRSRGLGWSSSRAGICS